MSLIEFISQPWHWAVTGTMIVLIMVLMLLAGRRFGVSTSFETLCTIAGAGKRIKFFNVPLKNRIWQLFFLVGGLVGGYIAIHLLGSDEHIQLSQASLQHLDNIGIDAPASQSQGVEFVPLELFSFESLLTLRGIIVMVIGGFLVGFGARWAKGCTSGHAISGLAMLQWPSLVAVIGFFIGGLIMTHLLLPIILSL